MPYDQTKRLLKITTALDANTVLLTELEGVDELSKPFLFRLKIVTDQPVDTVKGLLGTEVTLEFGPVGAAESRRPFRGFFRRLVRTSLVHVERNEWEWEAEVVPRLWFMSLRTNLRIHKDATFPDIVRRMFGESGVTAPDILAGGILAATKLDFCVQYRESDLAFLSRTMERFGWFYFHKHGTGSTTLVIADANVHADEAVWLDASGEAIEEDFSVQSGQCAAMEFDPLNFSVRSQTRPRKIGGNALEPGNERYDYPGAFIELSGQPGQMGLVDVARALTDVAMEREEARYHLRRGASINPRLDPGKKATIDGVDVLVTAVTHRARDYSHWTDTAWAQQDTDPPFYTNTYTCIPHAVPFRPAAVTPRPVVEGPQTAKVHLGGDNPNIDQHGRVKLQFHWDRDAQQSAWVRVSQGWASNGFGQMHLPRTGDEVIVEFLEGDPDRPIVTGRVYNGMNKVPFDLPGKHMQSGIKTSRDNQLRFDDTHGAEEVYTRAAKAMLTEVVDTETHKVGVGNGKGDRVTEIKNSDTLIVKQGDLQMTAQTGKVQIKASASGVEIEAAQQIVLKVGANKLTIGTSGVTIEGAMVEVKATGMVKINGSMIMIG